MPKVRELLDDDSVKAIKRIKIPANLHPDRLVWTLDPKGMFSVHSVYKMHVGNHSPTSSEIQWNKVWKLKLHDRLKMLLWHIGNDAFPTNLNFVCKVGFGDPVCPLCNVEEESLVHLFFLCPVAQAIWFGQQSGLLSP